MQLIHGLLQYYEKYIDLAQCLDQVCGKQEFWNQFAKRYKAKQLGENLRMALHD